MVTLTVTHACPGFAPVRTTAAKTVWRRGQWQIDEWDCGVNVLTHDTDMGIMRFGPLEELAAWVADHEQAASA